MAQRASAAACVKQKKKRRKKENQKRVGEEEVENKQTQNRKTARAFDDASSLLVPSRSRRGSPTRRCLLSFSGQSKPHVAHACRCAARPLEAGSGPAACGPFSVAPDDDEKTKRQIKEVAIERFDHGLSPQPSPQAQLQSQAHAQLQLQFE